MTLWPTLIDRVRLEQQRRSRLMIAIDGVDGAGKSHFQRQFLNQLQANSVPAIGVHIDDFHRPRHERYARGRDSPKGFYFDSFNYALLQGETLEPFCTGSALIRQRAFDCQRNHSLESYRLVPKRCVLVIEGIFLHRPLLRHFWDLSLFLHVPFKETYRRMALRDGCPAVPESIENQRYYLGQKFYLHTQQPQKHCDYLIDNSNYFRPQIQ